MVNAVYSDYLAHYGVKGQKWGVRNYQNEDGTYTDAGRQRYWGSTGQRIPRQNQQAYAQSQMRQRPVNTQSIRRQQPLKKMTPQEEAAAKKRRRNRVLAIVGGTTLAAALGYAAYRHSTKLRNDMRKEMLERGRNADFGDRLKYWDKRDIAELQRRNEKRVNEQAASFTRRDAIAARYGIRLPATRRDREMDLQERRSSREYGNWFRGADNRGHLNQQIADARRDLDRSRLVAHRSKQLNTAKYRGMNDTQWDKAIESNRQRLEELLYRRAAIRTHR